MLVCLHPLERMEHVMLKMNVRTKEVPGMAPVLEVMAFVVSVSQSLISFFPVIHFVYTMYQFNVYFIPNFLCKTKMTPDVNSF